MFLKGNFTVKQMLYRCCIELFSGHCFIFKFALAHYRCWHVEWQCIIIDEKETKQNTLQLTDFIVLALWLKIILSTVENIYICGMEKGLVFRFSQIKFVTSGVQLAGPAVKFKYVTRFEFFQWIVLQTFPLKTARFHGPTQKMRAFCSLIQTILW